MVERAKQKLWIGRMKKDHPCFAKMLKPLSSYQSQESYSYKIQKFIKFADEKGYVDHAEDFETLDPAAKEITIIIKEIAWVKRELRQVHTTMTPPNMRSMHHSNGKLSILEGPWEFKITL